MKNRKQVFGCYSHVMEDLDPESIQFMFCDDKYKPAKEIHYCHMCKSTIRVLK